MVKAGADLVGGKVKNEGDVEENAEVEGLARQRGKAWLLYCTCESREKSPF